MKTVTAIVLVFTLGALAQAEDDCVLAMTESGLVCGARMKATNGEDFVSFMGMRYAKAPIGELRFAEPQSPEPYDGIFDATTPGLVCPQLTDKLLPDLPAPPQGEDCLRVNVHVPLSAVPQNSSDWDNPRLPVFVYIHGGSFITGSGNPDTYGPEYLMQKGIILVTINYRLASIGFLSLDSEYIPGNAGLRDALFALKWVKRNIELFGGDPDEITLGGQSAGGAISHLVSISPAVKGLGLFKRGIFMSGNALANFYTTSPISAKNVSALFLKAMGISSAIFKSPKSIHQELIKAPIEKILEANQYVYNKAGLALTFCPVQEKPQKGFTTMLPKDPEVLLKEGYGKEIASIFGFTNNECQVFKPFMIKGNLEKVLQTSQVAIVPQNLLFTSNVLTIPVLTREIKSEYYNGTTPTLEKYLYECTDAFYKYPVMRIADKRLESGAEPTFVYEFGYHGEDSVIKAAVKSDWPGAGHGEDVTYFFRVNWFLGPSKVDELAQSNPDSKMKEWMTTFIANFVRTGDPASIPAEWLPTNQQFEFQSIEEPMEYKLQLITPYLRDKKKFWNKLYKIGRVDLFR
uniref:Carboxylic ester hydrolase n=1 Tax=Cnaphalocrocis medinalis TaxID=437488 RepID=A0A1U9X1S8_CNAME|nr:carboxylesterase [Cnaphalocrocis medinalis]